MEKVKSFAGHLLFFILLILLAFSTSSINNAYAFDLSYIPVLNDFKIYNMIDEQLNNNTYLIKGNTYKIYTNFTYASYIEIKMYDGLHNILLKWDNSTKQQTININPNDPDICLLYDKDYEIRKNNTEFILNYTITIGDNILDYFDNEITWRGYSTLVGEYVGYTIDDYEIESEYVNGGGPLLSWENIYTVRNTMYRDSGQNKMFRSNVDAYEEYMRTLLIINVDYDDLFSLTSTDYRHILWYVGTSHGTYVELRTNHKSYGLFVGMGALDVPILHSFSTKADGSDNIAGFSIPLNTNIYMIITRRNNMVKFDYYLDGFNMTLLNTETKDIGFTDKLDFSVIGSSMNLLGHHLAQSRTSYRAYDFEQTGGSFAYSLGWYWINDSTDFFVNFFNEGGIPKYTFNGNYNIYDDNDIFSIGAYNDGSWVRFDVLYNKLQHMHFNVELDINGDWDSTNGIWENCTGGYYEYGMDYMIDDALLNGWKVRIYPYSVVVGHQNLGVDYDYVTWSIEHYFYNRTLADYQLIKTEYLYSNFNGYDNENSTPDYHNRTSATFWVDLWYSNDNSSKKVATRINTEWFGMYEQGASWWFGYGGFRPVIGELTNSISYDNVYDSDMNITTIRENVDIVRFWGKVAKVTGGNKEYKMYNYLMKNKVIAPTEMIGVDTPALIETKVMDMPQTGFLSPLIKVLSDIQKMIILGILGVLSYLSVAIDNMLVGLGLPPLLSIFYNMLISLYDIFALLYDNFINLMIWVLDALNNMIDSIFLIIPRYLYFVGMVVDIFINYYNNIVLLFTGGIFGISDFWTNYNMFEIIQLYLICIFPFIELAKIESSEDPLGTFINDAKTFIEMIMGIFHMLYAIVQIIFDLIGRLLGILPF